MSVTMAHWLEMLGRNIFHGSFANYWQTHLTERILYISERSDRWKAMNNTVHDCDYFYLIIPERG